MDEKTFCQNRNRQMWIERILACKASGVPVKTWCEQNGIAYSTYYDWLKKTRQDLIVMHERMTTAESSSFLDISPPSATPVVFHELPLLSEPASDRSGDIMLTLPGLTLTVEPDATLKQIRAAMAVLRSLCC